MNQSQFLFVLVAAMLPLSSITGCSHDHHDHEHGKEKPEPEPVRHTVFGSKLLLFMEHPPLVKGESARFLAHFSVLETGEPVRDGSMRVVLGSSVLDTNEPARDGLFIPEGKPDASGEVALRVILDSSGLREEFDLGTVRIHETAAEGESASADAPADAVAFLLEQQWKVGLLVRPAVEAQISEERSFSGSVELDDHARALVSAGSSGVLIAMDGRMLPRVGERVEQGTQIAWIEPLLTANDAAQVRVWELESRLLEEQIRHDLELARAQSAQADRELARTRAARERGFTSQAELELAEAAVLESRVSVSSLEMRLETIAKREPVRSTIRIPVLAPISGVVVECQAVTGQHVQAGDVIIDVVNPDHRRVRIAVPEESMGWFASAKSLNVAATLLGGESVRIDGAECLASAAVELPARCLTVLARPSILPLEWKAGVSLTIRASGDTKPASVTIPVESIVTDQGLATAYVMLDGELFQRRVLKLGLRDSTRVEVLSGIANGERVVTRGGHLVRLASLAPEGFGHGHAH